MFTFRITNVYRTIKGIGRMMVLGGNFISDYALGAPATTFQAALRD
jgi:hypothetical protein